MKDRECGREKEGGWRVREERECGGCVRERERERVNPEPAGSDGAAEVSRMFQSRE